MDLRPVVFLDSGVGGLPYCAAFRAIAPNESVVYIADTANFPYGPKPKEELSGLLISLVSRLRAAVNPKLIVLACNTASISALESLRKAFPDLPFVGTVPAVKPAALASGRKRIGVIATERTIADPYIRNLAHRCVPGCEVVGMSAPDLVDFVEYRYAEADDTERLAAVRPYVEEFRKRGVDGLVLGCTHFLYLASLFSAAAEPDLKIFHSLDGVAQRALALLGGGGTGGPDASGSYRLIYTGNSAPAWFPLAALYGLVPERAA